MKRLRETAPLLLVAGIALIAALPLWQAGFLNKRIIGESPYLLMRVFELYSSLKAGIFPVRWMPDGAYGYGYPFFSFYAALPYYVAAGFHFFGFDTILSIKLTQTLSFLVGGLGVYLWTRRHLRSRAAAVTAAALFTFAPMHLINIYVRGDSMSEFWAMSMYPLILWAVDLVIESPRPLSMALLAINYAGLMLSHNISALIFTPLIGLYILWRLRRKLRTWLGLAAGLILGLALSAWFWIPALLERSTLRMEDLLTGFFDYHNNFLDNALVQGNPFVAYEAYPYRLGWWQTLIVGIGATVLLALVLRAIYTRLRHPTVHQPSLRLGLWGLLGFLFTVAMTLSLSTWAYDHVALLAYLQFPWRWLSITALMGAVVGALAADMWRSVWLRRAVCTLIITLTIYFSLSTLPLNFIPLTDAEITPVRLNQAEYYSGDIGTTVRADYIPLAVTPRPFSGPAIMDSRPIHVIDGDASGTITDWQANHQTWQVQVNSDRATLAIPTFYWPGWSATLEDGSHLPISAVDGLGWIQTTVPRGEHTIRFQLHETPTRQLADDVSLLALFVLLALLIKAVWPINPVIRRRGTVVVAGLVLSSLVLHLLPPATPAVGPVASQFTASSYHHVYPDGLRFPDGAQLLSYDYPAEVSTGQPLVVHLNWAASTAARVELVPPLDNIWGYKAALAVGTGTDSVGFDIPADAAPGLYYVRLEHDDTVYDLTPIRISGLPEQAEPIGIDLGDTLRLLKVTTGALDQGRLNLYLKWQVLRPITRTYSIRLQLSSPAGIPLASHDAQLGVYGTVPAVYWGSVFTDWLTLPDLDGIPPGDGYRLTVTIHENGKALGTTEIQDVVIQTSPSSDLALTHPGGDVTLKANNVEQGNMLMVLCRWPGKVMPGAKIRWTFASDNGSREIETPLLPGARLDWWQADQVYEGITTLVIPLDLEPGTYRLSWQIVDSDERPITSESIAGEVQIEPTSRIFTPPSVAQPVDVTFGDLFRLSGYQMTRQDGNLAVQLVWNAKTATETDYTYFVHVQRTDASKPAAQIDTMPHGYSYPPSLWLPGEYVVDSVSIDISSLPPGTYNLWVGWYNPHTGQRLAVPNAPDGRYLLGQLTIL